jgi:hypothetical protein
LAGVARKKLWSQASSFWRYSRLATGWCGFWSSQKPNRLLLYGNVDVRQVELAFNNSVADR